MSNDFTRRNDDFSDNNQTKDQGVPAYQADPWMERQALQEKKKGCGGCLWGCGCGCLTLILLAIVGSIVFYYQCVRGVPVIVSPETTVITEPLKSDGKSVDFFQAIEKKMIPDVPAGDNGFADVFKAYGKMMFQTEGRPGRDWQFDETCRKLELDPASTGTAVFEKPDDYVSGRVDAETLAKLASAPWTFEEQPKMKDWLEKVGPGLDIVRQAAMKKHYFMPMVRRNDKELAFLSISLEALNFQAQLANALKIRSMYEFGDGKTENAWNDFLASLRLARFVFTDLDFSNFEKDVRTLAGKQQQEFDADDFKDSVEKVFAASGKKFDALLRHDRWTKDQLDGAIADLETLPSRPNRRDFLEMQQFIILDFLCSMNNMQTLLESVSTEPLPPETGGAMTMFGFNWNILAKSVNEHYNEYRDGLDNQDIDELLGQSFDEIIDELNSELNSRGNALSGGDVMGMITVTGRSKLIGQFVGPMLPFIEKLIYKEELSEAARCRILRAALALKRHRLDKDDYPATLEELNLKPLQPALPLKYEKTAAGFVLSCGDLTLEYPPQP